MADVWLGRLNRFYEKFFNVKGGPTIVDLSPSVQVVMVYPSGVEDRAQLGWSRFGFSTFQPPVTGQNSAIRLRNPAGSNVIAVIEKLSVFGGSIDQPFVTILSNTTDFTPFLVTRLDPRTQGLSTIITSKGSAVGSTGSGFSQVQLAGSGTSVDFILTDDSEIVIGPGDSVTVWSNTVTLILNLTAVWRERPLESSELA